MAENESSWLRKPGENLSVTSGPIPQPGEGHIVIKNVAVAINPLDWKIQDHGLYLTKYPFILGQDVAGVVDAVGPGVTRFQKGQRVIAHCHGFLSGDPANSAFQMYSTTLECLTAEIPDHLSFEKACVLPLAVSTACAGLYQNDYLNLPLPSVIGDEPTGQTILIWGGASSVGATAIQLASASGLKVVTTASSPNHEFVKSLGAELVFDYRDPIVVENIVKALGHANFAGVYDAISEPASFEAVAKIMGKLNSSAPVASVHPYDTPTPQFAPKFVLAYDIIKEPHKYIGEWIWGKFISQALINGRLKAVPDALVVGTGINAIQDALKVQKQGVSAKKVVVVL
ncbi:Zinc-binding alcohol dehydrogenase domain-containing protein cipB [Penicillium rolfsii]|nr:Zinc-binding alcohol dehydrogenase domain-containing protein cipB [Penicillium rolfsii]